MLLCSKSLDLMSSGEKNAESLGLEINKAKFFIIFAGAISASCAVCIGGTIGFVGLIVPHIVRRIYGAKHSILICASMLWGGIFLVLADLIARTIAPPTEIPVGIITALTGTPFFIWLLFSTRKISHD